MAFLDERSSSSLGTAATGATGLGAGVIDLDATFFARDLAGREPVTGSESAIRESSTSSRTS